MTTSALSSPSLGSTSLMEQGLFSPDLSGGPRLVVQKQVVKVKGIRSEASVVLYYKLAVLSSAITQTLQLFPDDNVTLKSSQVYPVSASKEGRIVIPPDASRHLRKAAEVLGIRRASLGNSLSSQDGRASPPTTKKAKITTSNFHVSLVVPPYSDMLTSPKGEDRCHYIAVVHLTIPLALTPPKWPFMVHIPLARCLNNYLYFSVDESCAQEQMNVDLDPNLLAKSNPMTRFKSSESTTDADIREAKENADEDLTLSGPFSCTSSLRIRWAAANAGVVKNSNLSSNGHQHVRADALHVSAVFSQFKKINENVAQVLVRAQLSLRGPYYPGLEQTANIDLQLEASPGSHWMSETVSVTPSKQSASSFRSFSTTRPASTSVHLLKPGPRVCREQQIRSPSPRTFSAASSDDLLDADATLDDEGNLLDVRPPREIASSGLYSSSDSEDEENTTSTSATSNEKIRRYSLGRIPPDTTSTRPISLSDEAEPGRNRTLHLVLSTIPLSQRLQEFTCTVESVIQLPVRNLRSQPDGTRMMLPLIKANEIALEYEATVQGASFQAACLGKGVQRNGIDAKRCIALSANPSPAEIHEARLEVLTDAKTDPVNPPAPILPESSPEFGSETDDAFTSRTFRGNEQRQTAQVDSLSGMIQQASVEVYSTAMIQEDMLLAEGSTRKGKTTHVVRSSWPSAPAPSSGDVCGAFLPQMVFALPCSDESELQVLCASVNGHSVHIEENAAGDSKSSSSRILDLRLPESLKRAAKIEVFLLYMQEASDCSNLCLFPPVASSIADLTITLHYGALISQTPDLSLSNQPVSLYTHDFTAGDLHRKQVKAHMLPSMTSVNARFDAKVQPITLATTLDAGPLRRMKVGKGAKTRRRLSLLSMGHVFHALCTILLAVLLVATVHTLDPVVDSLTSKVDQLALALNIDFTDGYWMPEPKLTTESTPVILPPLHTTSEMTSLEESIKDHSGLGHLTPSRNSEAPPSEPRDLSVDTTSFALLMQSLSSAVTSTLTWPVRILFAILGRSL